MSGWDALRDRKKGAGERVIPRCRKCQRVSVLDPCRRCATPAQLAKYPPDPAEVRA